ncbi:valine--tRNA ligase, mitochondrial [Diachasma alloeum]|uniref:valine--tRNA ligase, mitochondrial n=1 Tax=Diachasma alloeum TaxID=454923 RepID=UPI00073831DD|nr:valine--tRNA ligase, mitochondrial [Diachasma alloeum]
MNVNRLNELRRSVTLCRSYCYKLNEARVADFPPTYETRGVEEHWNKVWETNRYFTPKDGSATFRMILPPPNVTGVLHLGHALTVTIQDVLARWHRMRGESVIWVPGLDHAGIATQAAVEKYLLATKGVTRKQMGREEFLSAIEEWKTTKGNAIVTQLKGLGASLDWSREYFTMSKEHNAAVTEAFVTLSDRNLLYRSKDLVNWSPALQSTISDIEVELLEVSKRTEIPLPGYKKKIPFGEVAEVVFKVKNSPEELVVATTRVESMLGDAALAVHPEDTRYSQFIGKEVFHPLRECFIPVIADSSVKRDFGTGVLKITPAHDRTDLEIGRRHDLELIEVINEDGTMNERAKAFEGLPRFVARQKILDHLADKGLLRAVRDHPMVIPLCSRSGDVVEHLVKEQWFVRTQRMAERVLQATKNNRLRIDPEKFEEPWVHRLENMRDWCVSRQLWWGHRIPAFKCSNSSESHWLVARTLSEAQDIASSRFGSGWNVQQDNDVLDTWFSAGLLPLSAMGWPSGDCSGFYPLNLMETGHDILQLWVTRMAMLCEELTGQLPFEEILLHGVLCDAQGKKMSKSLGNVINPEYVIDGISLEELNNRAQESFASGILSKSELKRTLSVNSKMFPGGIPECGVDALRLTLCAHDIKSGRISFNVVECKTNKHFCNKIWQACRYVLLVTDDGGVEEPKKLSTVDRWILSKMELMVEKVNENFRERNFYRAVNAVRQFFYYEFCDFYLEGTKFGLKNGDKDTVEGHKWTLVKCLEVSLRVLAPVMPYLSEDLYSRLRKKLSGFLEVSSLMEAPYPQEGEMGRRNEALEQQFEHVLTVVMRMRNILSHVSRKSILEVHVVVEGEESYRLFAENINFLAATTRVPNLKIVQKHDYVVKEESVCHEEADCKLYFLLSDKEVEDQMKKKILTV